MIDYMIKYIEFNLLTKIFSYKRIVFKKSYQAISNHPLSKNFVILFNTFLSFKMLLDDRIDKISSRFEAFKIFQM
jgi:hypothetical protein